MFREFRRWVEILDRNGTVSGQCFHSRKSSCKLGSQFWRILFFELGEERLIFFIFSVKRRFVLIVT